MDSIFSSLPVTAIDVCQLRGKRLILAAQGPTLIVYDYELRKARLRARIFESNVIHGISSRESDTEVQILVWAGNIAAVLWLLENNVSSGKSSSLTQLTASLSVTPNLSSWILFGELSVIEKTGVVRALLITTHNELHEIVCEQDRTVANKSVQTRLLVSGPACVLYSAHFYQNSQETIIAAGTVFGEIVLWSTTQDELSGLWSARVINLLLGHSGSIFGIRVSHRFARSGHFSRILATCSDDRTIRLWDLDESSFYSDVHQTRHPIPVMLSDITGFGEPFTNESALAMTWAHLSRIWTVQFLPTRFGVPDAKMQLISTGEDASFQLWEVDLDSSIQDVDFTGAHFKRLMARTNHSGKNIWSSRIDYHRGEYLLYTGGADGSIVATTLFSETEPNSRSMNGRFHMPLHQVLDTAYANETNGVQLKTTSIKHYAFTGYNAIVAATDDGALLIGQLRDSRERLEWKTIFTAEDRRPLLLCYDRDGEKVFFTGAGRNMAVICKKSDKILDSTISIENDASSMCIVSKGGSDAWKTSHSTILVINAHRSCATVLTISVNDTVKLEREAQLLLPPKFVPTSACQDVALKFIIVGSRAGSIALFDSTNDLNSSGTVFDNIHGKDTVTSLQMIPEYERPSTTINQKNRFLLSTGRDGSYAIWKVSTSSPGVRLQNFQIVHRSIPPIGPNLEGAYLATSVTTGETEILFYGFKSRNFLVWNETKQIEVLSVDCGGAHRNWAYTPFENGEHKMTPDGGSFVWTKARAVNFYWKINEDTRVIGTGGHGREIKALAISPVRLEKDSLDRRQAILVATGAEDTKIRLFKAISNDLTTQIEEEKMAMVGILNKHTTGICHLEFSACGRYLISSGGCEELYVWKINLQVPILGIGFIFESMLPKTEVDADARITHFSLEDRQSPSVLDSEVFVPTFIITAAYSNGKYKVFEYFSATQNQKGTFNLLQEVVEGSFCLTQISKYGSWEGAANGTIFTAGTNGVVNVHLNRPNEPSLRHRIHQNSIQSIRVIKLKENSSKYLIVTAGDDNAIGLTLFGEPAPLIVGTVKSFKSLFIAKAHAAAVTGVTLLSQETSDDGSDCLTIASVGNDQRVKLWRIAVAPHHDLQSEPSLPQLQVQRLLECWTTVADAAAIDTLQNPSPNGVQSYRYEILVVGVGMEILRIPNLRIPPEPSVIFEK